MRPTLCTLALLLASPAALAGDLVVGPPESGMPFPKVQAAIDAAAPGDRVILLPGEYVGTVVVDKPIELWGAGSTTTWLTSFTHPVLQWGPPLVIEDIPADARVRVVGIGISDASTQPKDDVICAVIGCAGRVEFVDVEIHAYSELLGSPAVDNAYLVVKGSAHVVATRLRTRSSSSRPLPVPGGSSGYHGVVVVDSHAWFDRCDVQAKSGGEGGHGLLVVNSHVDVVRSRFAGERGFGLAVGAQGTGGSGIVASQGSVVRVHGGDGASLEGAPAMEEPVLWFQVSGSAGNGAHVDATSRLEFAADVAIVGGAAAGSIPAGSAVDAEPGAAVVALARRLPTVALAPALAGLGSTIALDVQGEPGAFAVHALSLATATPIPLAAIGGAALLDVASLAMLGTTPLGASGASTVAFPLPTDPALHGLVVAQQVLQVTPTDVDFSTPALFAVLP